ncbi:MULTISPECIES: phosphate ABC transporter permease PstA [Microbispora]|uniref:Phosphate transport system permease protein PstA n=3 Tax=Microbispora TaxID=2005 RepID=A0ABY3LWK3_9ACTN|nr:MULTISPECIES: phosphate ABC transporter permease PstA [Microbispora]MBO4272052.1 phosphate ABC transporter permease PstA [Microbispora triticiradicis]RGA02124.1 phosphate ABC transporter permease PstA [Microbispora triticiradicis]TLP51508.1 phosphate ABC transporter permease PstA [Microbispora fusca]TYB57079.1 phosphate ABC transporter permease PstA [Microbispora tritici]
MTVQTGIQPISATRRAKDRLVQVLVYLAFALAVIPLVSVLWLVVKNGIGRFDMEFFTHSMRNIGARDAGGGAYHAIIGTLEQVLLASLIAVPIGLLTAVYLVEYGEGGRLSRTISFFVDVMTGVPSVVSGLFVLAFWILVLGMPFSGFAGALALSILMMPVVVRATEEMLRLVPRELREASYALGVPKWRTIVKVVLPTALPGIVTGVMLAVARVAGETAPLLLTVFVTDSINNDPFNGPQMGLPLYVFNQTILPTDVAVARAWTGALTLILIVMLLNLVARLITWWRSPARRR